MTGVWERVRAGRERLGTTLGSARVRWPWFDHLVRTYQRYQIQAGDRLAGAVSYFAFLSFFPIVALAFAVFGYFLSVTPDAPGTLRTAIDQYLPGLAEKLPIQQIADSRTSAGIIGLLGLLYAGLGAIDALRGALREISMTTEAPLGFAMAKLRDLAGLVLVGTTMVASVLVAGFATQASGTVAGWVGLSGSPVATTTIWLVGLSVSVLADVMVFLILLRWLGRIRQPLPVLLRGALFGAIGFALLKQLAALVLSSTLNNPVYGVFAVVVGLLVWINLSARVIMYAAAWTATASLGLPPDPTPVPATTIPA